MAVIGAAVDAGISQQSYYRWRKEYGALELDQARRMKDLELQSAADGLQGQSDAGPSQAGRHH
jgi:hypothetical protein